VTTDDLEARAAAMDHVDTLAPYRHRFVEPGNERLVYLDGNSLGRPPLATRTRVLEVLDTEWSQRLIRSWTDGWVDLPARLGDLIATGVLGARPGEVVVGENTTVALYKAISAALDGTPDRDVVVIERDNFPTDRYVVESLAEQRGLTVRWIEEVGVDGVAVDAVRDVLDDRVAVVVLSQADYRSAALVDMRGITEAAHDAGSLMLWDLCHSAGVVPIGLESDGVDLAVGCTYKYLNGGPGAPAYTYVRRSLQSRLRQPIWGWWGRQRMFDMEQGYQPADGIASWLTGTPGVLSMAAVEPGVAMVVEAGVDAIRAKSVALTSFAVDVFDERLAGLGFQLLSPREAGRRGGHVTLGHPDAEQLSAELIAHDVIPDFRRPDGIRLGLSPLTTTFDDVYAGLTRLAGLAASC
jgi:kynureninase